MIRLLEFPCIQNEENIEKLFTPNKINALEHLLKTSIPLLIDELQLCDNDIEFVERVANIVLRQSFTDRATEYIVRYMEFYVLNQQHGAITEATMVSFQL